MEEKEQNESDTFVEVSVDLPVNNIKLRESDIITESDDEYDGDLCMHYASHDAKKEVPLERSVVTNSQSATNTTVLDIRRLGFGFEHKPFGDLGMDARIRQRAPFGPVSQIKDDEY